MTLTPEARALAAAEKLAAQGKTVSARAVREAAGVGLAVASTAARTWKEKAQQDAVQAPAIPDAVMQRFAVLWADVYAAAAEAFSAERTALKSEIKDLTEERDAFMEDVTAVEEERDTLASELDAVAKQAEEAASALRDDLARERSRADKAEGATDAWKAERVRMDANLDDLRRQVEQLAADLERERADRAGSEKSTTS
jgi:uncharacterized protein YPO0396